MKYLSWLMLLLSSVTPSEDATQSVAVEVALNPILMADPRMIRNAQGVRTKLHPPQKTNERLLISDKPWENATLNWFSVLHHDGKYRMWYECYDVAGWPTADDTSFCYAESDDGIHWTKPVLGLVEYAGSKENNILFRQIGQGNSRSRVHGSGVFIDPLAPEGSRFKGVSQGLFQGLGERPYYIAGMTSPDGLRWNRLDRPICEVFADSQYSALWNPVQSEYMLFGRVSGNGRAIGRSVSNRFDSFPSLSLVLQTDQQHPVQTDLYNPACCFYPGRKDLLMMMPSLLRHQEDTLDIHIALSHDGEHWTWPDRNTALIPLGACGEFDSGSLYMANGIVEVQDEVWFYFGASRLKHEETNLETLADPENRRVYSRAVSKKDRLVSASAGKTAGRYQTGLLRSGSQVLSITADVRSGGEIRIGLLDADGREIPGFGTMDCEPIRDSCMKQRIRWRHENDVDTQFPESCRIKVHFVDADVFSFQFINVLN